jgi:hypothetical protein
MASGGIGNQSPATIFQARLDTADGASDTLTLRRYIGKKVVVSGVTVTIPTAGLTRNIADNLISNVGADAGAAPAASTLYYVYVSNQRAPFSPSSIRLCATAPSLVNGVKYLGTSGNALNWRFVGWVKTNATPEFESTLANRLIVNYYNRILGDVLLTPGYVNDDTPSGYTQNNTSWDAMNGGTDSQGSFISNGEDAVSLKLSAFFQAAFAGGNEVQFAVGVDTITSPDRGTYWVNNIPGTTQQVSSEALYDNVLPEGDHTFAMLCSVQSITITVVADLSRHGAPADPFGTRLEGTLFI